MSDFTTRVCPGELLCVLVRMSRRGKSTLFKKTILGLLPAALSPGACSSMASPFRGGIRATALTLRVCRHSGARRRLSVLHGEWAESVLMGA